LGDHRLAWLPWVALATAEALLLAVLAPLITLAYRWLPRWRDTRGTRLVLLPALVAGAWSTRELIMSNWPYGGFPWGRVAMSQADSPIATVASWVGVTGLGFLIVALCAVVVEAVFVLSAAGRRRADPAMSHGQQVLTVLPAVGLAALLFLLPGFPTQNAGTIRVGAAQGDGPAAYVDQRKRLGEDR